MRRTVYLQLFVGSTVDEITEKFNDFFEGTCPGNIVKTELYKYDGVYQYEVLYALAVDEYNDTVPEDTY